jgi:glycosyltransferase involved in cell wall biosynthesis
MSSPSGHCSEQDPTSRGLSIVMPVYNCERYLDEAIRSVVEQTDADWEMVIVDDGSVDGTPGIAERWAAIDKRIQVLRQANAGPAAAMNTGIRACCGDWVLVMHGDDVMLPTRVGRIRRNLGRFEGLGIITAGVELIAEDGRKLGSAAPALPSNPFFLDAAQADLIIGGLYHTALNRKMLEAVGGYDVSCRVNEDVALYNKACEQGYGVLILEEVLMKYRVHSGAASSAKARELKLHWRYLKDCIRQRRLGFAEPSWEEFLERRAGASWISRINETRKDAGQRYYRLAASAMSSRNWLEVGKCTALSLMLSPMYFSGKALSRLR